MKKTHADKKLNRKYQAMTEKIASEGGLQTDNRMYFDPIYKANMQGNFYRELLRSKKSFSKIVMGGIFLIVLPCIAALAFTINAFYTKTTSDFIGLIYVYGVCGLAVIVGLKMVRSGIKNSKKDITQL